MNFYLVALYFFKYRDIIVMTPLVNINASIIFKIWDQVLEVVTEIRFDVAVTVTDGVSSNMSFFKKKMLEHPGEHPGILSV